MKPWTRSIVALLVVVPLLALGADTSQDVPGQPFDTTRTVGAVYMLAQALGFLLGLFPSHTIVGKVGRWLATFPGQLLRK